jgi:glycosyl transferase family 25
MHSGLNHFDSIIYINLAHRKDRNEEILNELKRLEVLPEKIVRIEAVSDPLNGHRGCALSHANALQYAIDHNLKNALILEDDFISTRSSAQIGELINYFAETVKNEWDVFLLGGNIKSYEKTSFPRINRSLIALCAHAYAVNRHYFPLLQALFKNCYNLMESDLFFTLSDGKPIDQQWNYLMSKDRWYFMEIFAQQRGSESDINLCFRDRRHTELY